MSLGFYWHFDTFLPHYQILLRLRFGHELWHYQKYLSLLCYEVCNLVLIELKALYLCYCMLTATNDSRSLQGHSIDVPQYFTFLIYI